MRTPEEQKSLEDKAAREAKLYGFLYAASPGIVGALASGFFVAKSTWTSRAVGFVVGETVVLGGLAFAGCGFTSMDKPAGYCLISVPRDIWNFITSD